MTRPSIILLQNKCKPMVFSELKLSKHPNSPSLSLLCKSKKLVNVTTKVSIGRILCYDLCINISNKSNNSKFVSVPQFLVRSFLDCYMYTSGAIYHKYKCMCFDTIFIEVNFLIIMFLLVYVPLHLKICFLFYSVSAFY